MPAEPFSKDFSALGAAGGWIVALGVKSERQELLVKG